jgi:DNA polymerase I-like protein with 3'-5' exonuclease and polymerase domains
MPARKGPNLQNIPIRTKEGRRIRDSFFDRDVFYNALSVVDQEGNSKPFKFNEDLHQQVATMFGIHPNHDIRNKTKD